MKKRLVLWLCVPWLLAARAGNAQSDADAATADAKLTAASDASATVAVDAGPGGRARELLIQALSMVGVKYRYGGSSIERGFDCSGFVRFVFNQSLSMELPRSSYEMSRLGSEVGKDALEPGDLVFFNTLRRRFSHVAIYLGDGRFVHAPSRGKQVEIVDMADRYWQRRFNGARRLVKTD